MGKLSTAAALVLLVAGFSHGQAYDQKIGQRFCRKTHPTDNAARERCVSAEGVAGALMDDLSASSSTEDQHLMLAECRKRQSRSYQAQVACINRLLNYVEADTVCERARQAGDGSYQTKEACIKAELEARGRLED